MSSVMRFDTWQDSNGVARNAIIAVKDVLKTDTFSASVSAGGNVAVTDLSITHEVENPSNKLIITAFFGVAGSSAGRGQTGIAIHDGTNLIGVGDSASGKTSLGAGGIMSGSATVDISTMPAITFVHTPGAGSKTYTVRAVNITGATFTLYVNRNENDASTRPRTASALVIQEVAV